MGIRYRRWAGPALAVGLAVLLAMADAYWTGGTWLRLLGDGLNKYAAALGALGTILIAWFTWELRRSTHKLWDVSRQQTLSAHPPKMGVYHVQYRPASDTPVKGALVLINEGGGDTRVVSGRLRACYTESGLPQSPCRNSLVSRDSPHKDHDGHCIEEGCC